MAFAREPSSPGRIVRLIVLRALNEDIIKVSVDVEEMVLLEHVADVLPQVAVDFAYHRP